ncbi:hypothetical protein RBB50_003114 [Rhinocladiella similis]
MARRRPRLINTARFLTPPERQIIDNARVLLPQWRCVAPLALVQPGADDLKIEVVLRKSFDRILGRYTCRWSSLVEHNPRILDMDNTLEKFRETFYIVSNLPDLDEVNAAFAVLNATLDTFPQLLRENHPELLFSLVELAYGLSMPNFCALHAKIKPHVAEMASVILGSDHPFTVLLRMELSIDQSYNEVFLQMHLARWFLQNKRYTSALHCCNRSMLSSRPDPSKTSSSLADSISETVEISFKDGPTQPKSGYNVPVQAPVLSSVATMTQAQL